MRLRFAFLLLGSLAVATTSACRDAPLSPAPDRADVLFLTDAPSYSVEAGAYGYVVDIRVVFTNDTGDPVRVANCQGATSLTMQALVDGKWVIAWSPPMPLCLSAPIVIAPGAVQAMHVAVFSGYAGTNAWPQFTVPIRDGVFRLEWGGFSRAGSDGRHRPLANAVSNRFTLHFAPRPR